MAYEPTETKKFLNSTGLGHLWDKIRERYDSKLDNVVAGNDAISVADNNQVSVVISTESDNVLQLKTSGNKGLYVPPAEDQDVYTVIKLNTASAGAAASYQMQKYINGSGNPVDVGVTIDIPKDMVVESGSVVTKGDPGPDDPWPYAGTFIELILANATQDRLYIDVTGLIEYVTSGSHVGDMVVISIDSQHRVTASITDGTITKAKLSSEVRDLLDGSVKVITVGTVNGTINVDGTNVHVAGLNSAAYQPVSAFDQAGAAAAVLGTDTDTAATMTVHGVKQYASDVYSAIQPLTNAEIDAAVNSASSGG